MPTDLLEGKDLLEQGWGNIDASQINMSDMPQIGNINQDVQLPGNVGTIEQLRELERRATIAPSALQQNFLQGIRETGQGFGQLGIGMMDYLTNSPIEKELGISNERLPEYNADVLAQRNQFEQDFGGVPGGGFSRGAGRAAPYFLIPPGQNNPVSLGLIGAGVGGSQFAGTPEERQGNIESGAMFGFGIPAAMNTTAAASSYLAPKIGNMFDFLQRYMGKQTPGMINKLAGTTLDDQAIQRLEQSRQLGLDYLTPAEATQNQVLAARQGAVGKTDPGMELLVSKSSKRIDSEKKAIRTILDMISPDDSPAGQKAIAAANKLLGEKRAQLSKMAKPLYNNAYLDAVPDEWIAKQLNDPLIAKSAKEVSGDAAFLSDYKKWADTVGYQGPMQNTVKYWDLVRRRISDTATPDKLGKFTNDQRIAGDVARSLNNALDDVSQNYKKARNFFSEEAPASKALESSLVAKLAKLDDVQQKNVSRIIFDPNETSPKIFNQTKNAFLKEDPKLWNQLVRNEMERRLSAVKKDVTGSVFYSQVIGNDRDYKLFYSALSDNPSAQRKLVAAKNVFKGLINPRNVKSVEGQARINVDQPRNIVTAVQSEVMDIAGGRMDKAAIEFITNPKWDDQFKRVASITNAESRRQAMRDLLMRVNDSLVKAGASQQ